MQEAGRALAASVDAVYVLTLPGATSRQNHMKSLLERDLQIPASMITYFEGATCKAWGRWPPWLLALRGTLGSTQQQRPAWWLPPRLCSDDEDGYGGDAPPPCLQTRYRRCWEVAAYSPSAPLPAVCNELCYTLSMVGALRDFLQRQQAVERALILEDDVCATNALLTASSARSLAWLHSHRASWDLVKLGDCYRGYKAFFGHHKRMSPAEALATGSCATSLSGGGGLRFEYGRGRQLPNNTLLPRLPWAYCTHALAVSRPMAEHLVAQAFPAADVFDGLLIGHVAPQARRARLRLHAFNQSLFAQIGKVTPTSILPSALLSYERTVSSSQEVVVQRTAARPWRARRRGSLYKPANVG